MPIKIHGLDISANVYPILGLCAEAGIDCEFVLCNLMEGAHKAPEFLKINPMHCIPTMDDDGFILWESKAILRYIAGKHKLEAMYPADVKARANCDLQMDFFGHSFYPVVGVKNLYPAVGFAGPDAEPKATEAKFNEDIVPSMKNLLGRIEGPLMGGTKPNLADFAFFGLLHGIMCKMPDCYVCKDETISGYYGALKGALPKYEEWAKSATGFYGQK
jgi:glutathione S-transferase